MKAELEELRKRVEEHDREMDRDSVQGALREVKEYTGRARDVSLDVLQMKIMRLEEAARKANHPEKKNFGLVM